LEISVLMAQFPSENIAKRSFDYRTLGLGFANLGALLMIMGVAYDSERGRNIAASISAIMGGTAYKVSALMAKEHGPFARYENNKLHMLKVIRNHKRAAYGEKTGYEDLTIKPVVMGNFETDKYLKEEAKKAWDEALTLGEKHGYRNAQVTVIAPTGTIGLVMDCDTTGIEPDFALVKFKKLAGGGYFKIINQSVPTALKILGYTQKQIDEIVFYAVGSGGLKGCPHINEKTLKEKGLSEEIIKRIDGALSSAFDISFAFSKYIIGEQFLRETLKLSDSEMNDPELSVLKKLNAIKKTKFKKIFLEPLYYSS